MTNINYEEMTDSNEDDRYAEPPISYKLMSDTILIHGGKHDLKPNTEKKCVDEKLDTI